MKLRSLFVVLLALVATSVSAQKLKKGSLTFLDNESKINLVFDFNGVTVDGKAEEIFVKKRMEKEKTPKEAEEWKKNWEGEWRKQFMNNFIKYCNDELKNKSVSQSYSNAKYTLCVKIVNIVPGYFAGPYSKDALVSVVYKFYKTEDMNTLVTQFSWDKICSPFSDYQVDEFIRLKMVFATAGKSFGALLNLSTK
ncbi:MAG: hypothetical protein LBU83_12705 [Bacteroidales bacterium]|jgi:hypothetical protein|nr:hypothetical protein [Bacteroidales bacterium]